ncbi:hypothetical protein EWM64_g1465 [Hericium alpestre]|uniref:C2H2-type domain-containing protein n=1 Tax=Hericium alpestre TaxID=135208 RepID=A0A4Z0A9F6_9AGAM|nr:hypothetical protein EWM64_g1465 [Hericium alpestre]
MHLPLNLFGFHGADNISAPLSSAAFAAIPLSAQAGPSSALLSNIPQAQSYDAYHSSSSPAGDHVDFYPSPFDNGMGDLGLDWNDSLLAELTGNASQTTSLENTYLATPGLSHSTPALPDPTELVPSYYSSKPLLPEATINEVEFGFDTYLPVSPFAVFNQVRYYTYQSFQESANPTFLSDRRAWASPAPEDIPAPAEIPVPEETTCPDDCFDITNLPLTLSESSQGPPLRQTSYDTSPTTASYDGSFFEQCLGPYSPAATSLDACSPSWPVQAKFKLPSTGDLLEWLYPAAVGQSSQPVASSKRRLEDDNAVAQPATKKIKEEGSYQGLSLPPLPREPSKRTHEDDDESIDEPLMKKRREEKRPALSAETPARRAPTVTLRHPNFRFAGPSHGDVSITEDRTKFSNCEVEGPEQPHSGSSSQTEQTEDLPPPSSEPIRCTRAGCTKTFGRKAERDRHVRSVHIKAKLPCPEPYMLVDMCVVDGLSFESRNRAWEPPWSHVM